MLPLLGRGPACWAIGVTRAQGKQAGGSEPCSGVSAFLSVKTGSPEASDTPTQPATCLEVALSDDSLVLGLALQSPLEKELLETVLRVGAGWDGAGAVVPLLASQPQPPQPPTQGWGPSGWDARDLMDPWAVH